MGIQRFFIEGVTLCGLIALSACATGARDNRFPQCDDDGDPWFEKYCVVVQGGVRTTIIMTKSDSTGSMIRSDSSLSYILFDNKLDRDGIVIFTAQPAYWRERGSHDSTAFWNGPTAAWNDTTAIWLPFPDIGSGPYEIRLESGDEVYFDTLLIMR